MITLRWKPWTLFIKKLPGFRCSDARPGRWMSTMYTLICYIARRNPRCKWEGRPQEISRRRPVCLMPPFPSPGNRWSLTVFKDTWESLQLRDRCGVNLVFALPLLDRMFWQRRMWMRSPMKMRISWHG